MNTRTKTITATFKWVKDCVHSVRYCCEDTESELLKMQTYIPKSAMPNYGHRSMPREVTISITYNE